MSTRHPIMLLSLLTLAACSYKDSLSSQDKDKGSSTGGVDGTDGSDGSDGGSSAAQCGGDVVALIEDGITGYPTIQEALDAASPGEQVLVCPGRHAAVLIVPADVSLGAAEPSEETILDGEGEGAVITVIGGEVSLSDLGVTEGAGFNWNNLNVGGGIAAPEADTLQLYRMEISANHADYGGGVLGPLDGQLYIEDSVITGNEAAGSGGGVYGTDVELIGTTLTDNVAVLGGGLVCDGAARNVLCSLDAGSSIRENKAETGGGVAGWNVELWGAIVQNNTATSCGGVYGSGQMTLRSNLVLENEGDKTGGGYCFTGDFGTCSARFEGGAVGENRTNRDGGGVVSFGCSLSMSGVIVNQNDGAIQGGGIELQSGSSLNIEDSTVFGNAASTGGGLFLDSSSTVTSVSTDWGSGTEDNSPDDVYVGQDGSSHTDMDDTTWSR